MKRIPVPGHASPARIDWDLARTRLMQSEKRCEEALSETEARVQSAYRERAIRLARPAPTPPGASIGKAALVFSLGLERHAVQLKDLAEVVPFTGCRPAPGAPPEICGVMSLHGQVLTVVDLGRVLTPSAPPFPGSGMVLIRRRSGQSIGFKVDRVEELRDLSKEDPASGPRPFEQGLPGLAGRFLLIDLDKILSEVFSHRESSIE
jgi:purine-binding chemotaxis protein CheW